jgi:FkbM family methyltransferase
MSKNELTVAFDLKRVADFWYRPYQISGITRYANTLYRMLQQESQQLVVKPIVYSTENSNKSLQNLSRIVEDMKERWDIDVSTSWRRLPSNNLALTAQEESQKANRFSQLGKSVQKNDAVRKQAVYTSSPFPDRMRWDIYHSPFGALPPIEYTGSATRVLTIHDCIYYKFPELYPGKDKPIIHEILDSIEPSRDFILCDSENTRRDLHDIISIDEVHTSVVPLAHEPLFANADRERCLQLLRKEGITPGRYILALGQTNPRKNVTRLAQAFAQVNSNPKLDDYYLLFVTSERNSEGLLAQLKDSQANLSFFKVVTNIDDETLASLYANAGLFAYVSLYEGFGIPTLEAMAAGCPVVASNTSSVPELVGEAGYYVDPSSVESIAEAIECVLSDSSVRKNMITKGRKQAAKFSWDRTVKMTLDFYEFVASSKQNIHSTTTVSKDQIDREIMKDNNRKRFSETELLARLPYKTNKDHTLVDVGSHKGRSVRPFVQNGWRVIAFEPEPENFSEFSTAYESNPNVTCIPKAVSDISGQKLPFYVSSEHPGIHTLQPFHPTHKYALTVETVRLDEMLAQLNIDDVTVLKIDIEGADFLALKSFDFEKFHPEVVVCQFMDDRSLPNFGYDHHEMVKYMTQFDYTAFVSEWSPIIEYGRIGAPCQHHFLQCVPYPLDHKPAWGNLIFISRTQVNQFEHTLAAYLDSLEQQIDSSPSSQKNTSVVSSSVKQLDNNPEKEAYKFNYQFFEIVKEKMDGLWVGFTLSFLLLIYALSPLPGSLIAAFLTLLPFFVVWRRRMIRRFIDQQEFYQEQIDWLKANKT